MHGLVHAPSMILEVITSLIIENPVTWCWVLEPLLSIATLLSLTHLLHYYLLTSLNLVLELVQKRVCVCGRIFVILAFVTRAPWENLGVMACLGSGYGFLIYVLQATKNHMTLWCQPKVFEAEQDFSDTRCAPTSNKSSWFLFGLCRWLLIQLRPGPSAMVFLALSFFATPTSLASTEVHCGINIFKTKARGKKAFGSTTQHFFSAFSSGFTNTSHITAFFGMQCIYLIILSLQFHHVQLS